MSFMVIWLSGAGLILAAVTLLWLVSLLLNDASIIDIFWGFGFVLSGWLYHFLSEGYPGRKILVMVLVTLWGLRLVTHIGRRNIGKGEDFRYLKWRQENGDSWWWRSFFKVFLVQGFLMWIISVPLLAAQFTPSPACLTWLDWLGTGVWLVGFYFEVVGDWQLTCFKADPGNKGKLLDYGVWRYTRHPNYFGDGAQWLGFYLIAAAAGGWWTVFSPVLMNFLLRYVSGVTMLERTMMEKKPGYREYAARTSAYIPWFPRKKGAGE
jgi:steroid 5-alpha reductase family enzyme